MSRSETAPAHPYLVDAATTEQLDGMTEDDAFAHAAGLFDTLAERQQALSDEVWALLEHLQRRYGYSYVDLARWLGWSTEGVRKRLNDYRARHQVEFKPRIN